MIDPGTEVDRRGRTLGIGGLTLIVAITCVNGSNFVFHAVISRIIGPADYGVLTALLGVVVLLAIPLGALQATVAQVVAERTRQDHPVAARQLLRWAVIAAVIAAVGWTALVVPIDEVLRLRSPIATLSLGLWMAFSLVSTILLGILMGERRFCAVAVSQVVGGGLIRLSAGILLVHLHFGSTGAVLATPIAALGTMLILLVACRRELQLRSGLRIGGSDAFRSVAGLGGATLLTTLDAWLARHFLPAAHAGYFAAASTAGRISLFLPGAITTVVFPTLAATGGQGPDAVAALRRAVVLVGGVSLLAVAVMALAPDLVVKVLFGNGYDASSSILPIIALADAGIAIVSLLTYFFLTRRSRWALSAWGACLLATGLGAAFHGSNRSLALDMLTTNLATAAALGFVAWRQLARQPLPATPDRCLP